MMTEAQINPALLNWARQRAGMTQDMLAQGLHTVTEKVDAWESGEAYPTFKQAQKIAAVTQIPFGFLFLSTPPIESLPLPDLRTISGNKPLKPSINLLDTVRDVLQKQAWYLEYLKEQGASALKFVGSVSVGSPVKAVVAEIKSRLKPSIFQSRPDKETYFGELAKALEEIGILVMRSGYAGSSTRRSLDVEEFRGFAISDPLAPVIFINNADAPAAKLFTLIHEAAHIWIGSTGISNLHPGSQRQEEIFCNAVAAEFLVPEEEFLDQWADTATWQANTSRLAAHFRVSGLVILRRALQLRKVSLQIYEQYYRAEREAYKNRQSEGGSYYRTVKAKNSARLSQAVLAEALSGRLLLREAGKLLGIQPSKISKYATSLDA